MIKAFQNIKHLQYDCNMNNYTAFPLHFKSLYFYIKLYILFILMINVIYECVRIKSNN